MPASNGPANNVLGKDFKGFSFPRRQQTLKQRIVEELNNQSDVDDLLVEE